MSMLPCPEGEHAADIGHVNSHILIGAAQLQTLGSKLLSHCVSLVFLVPDSHVLQVRWWTWWQFCTHRQM